MPPTAVIREHVWSVLGVTLLMAGCLGPAAPTSIDEPWPLAPTLVFQHYPGGLPSTVEALVPVGAAMFLTHESTHEPTIGATKSGAIFVTGETGTLEGTSILRSKDHARTWTSVGPRLGSTEMKQMPNSNDPFLYVDPRTDRLFKVDLQAVSLTIEVSDDEGETWTTPRPMISATPILHDHPSFSSAPRGGSTTLMYCVNRSVPELGPWCATSSDGIVWDPLMPAYPLGSRQCMGMSGHVHGANDGTFYRGHRTCDGPAVHRSKDGGRTWTQHPLPAPQGMLDGADGRTSHEIAVATDEANNVFAMWIGQDGLPYVSATMDQGETWRAAWMVAAPGITASGFPTIVGGAAGRFAFAYIGTSEPGGYMAPQAGVQWSGFLGFTLTGSDEAPVFTTAQLSSFDEPLYVGPCGDQRCPGFGDFIDITIDDDGRPYVALAKQGQGIVGTLSEGPALRGDALVLTSMEV